MIAFIGSNFDTTSIEWESVAPPILTISTPTNGAEFEAGLPLLVSGRALPGSPVAEVVRVTINGQLVDSLDANGNYFASVEVVDGSNTYEVIATDNFGNIVTESVSIVGFDEATVDPGQYQVVDAGQTEFVYTATSFNRRTNKLCVDYVFTNLGSTSIQNGALAVFGEFDPVSLSLDDADGTFKDGFYQILDTEVPANGLAPGPPAR